MAIIRATCPDCGDIELLSELSKDLRIVYIQNMAVQCAFQCLYCGDQIYVDLTQFPYYRSTSIGKQLLSADAKLIHIEESALQEGDSSGLNAITDQESFDLHDAFADSISLDDLEGI